MAENVNVNPASIQRNTIDAAIELTQLYIEKFQTEPENLENIYARFYALVWTLHRKSPDHLRSLVPKDILNKIN